MVKFYISFVDAGIVSYSHCRKISSAPNPLIVQVQMSEFTQVNVFLNQGQSHKGTIGGQCLVVLRDLTSLIDQAREAVNDPHSHLDNRVDGVKNEVGYIVIERTAGATGTNIRAQESEDCGLALEPNCFRTWSNQSLTFLFLGFLSSCFSRFWCFFSSCSTCFIDLD